MADKTKNPKIEALKEIARWGVFYLFISLLLGIEAQIGFIPENVVVLDLVNIPLREAIRWGVTAGLRYADKYKHVVGKLNVKTLGKTQPMGLLPF